MICPKYTRAKPCSGKVSTATCGEPTRYGGSQHEYTCPQICSRCEAHGGQAVALRSLRAHKAIYHPKEK
jgi:hypothetical protein